MPEENIITNNIQPQSEPTQQPSAEEKEKDLEARLQSLETQTSEKPEETKAEESEAEATEAAQIISKEYKSLSEATLAMTV